MTTITDEQKETAKRVDILSLIGDTSFLQGGKELFAPCIFCKGHDRFHVKPQDNVQIVYLDEGPLSKQDVKNELLSHWGVQEV